QQNQLSKNFAETMQNINFDKVIEQQNQLSKNFAETMQNINLDMPNSGIRKNKKSEQNEQLKTQDYKNIDSVI
ncbi:hypothetical protein, partial [Dapis sp. BLCC M172]|uniref:hypothetical protein n=1 Tax=Dapis sp. BLCC M172 TaxID=2975281 RepID=UPI003CF506C8